MRTIETSIRPADSGVKPPPIAIFCEFFLHFPPTTLNFPKIRRSEPKTQANNSLVLREN